MIARSCELAAVAMVWLAPRACMACSGPGAAALIERNQRIAWLLAGLGAVLALVFALLCRRRAGRWRHAGVFGLLVVAHPGWWAPVRGGDCGRLALVLSLGMTALTLIVGLVLWMRAGRASAPASAGR